MNLEEIDRKVFIKMWRKAKRKQDFRMMAFLRVLYRPYYPNWPEVQ